MAPTMFTCGCCLRFTFSPEEIEQRFRSEQIDKMLEKEKHRFRRQVKLLLLGAGESGKSTFLKQMRIIHGLSFDAEAIEEYRFIIYQNIVRGMKVLVDARQKLGIPWENPENENPAMHVMKFRSGMVLDSMIFREYVQSVASLWEDLGIKTAFERRNEYQLADSVRYFFENLSRIAQKDYIPSHQDILRARKATKGITECVVHVNRIPFHFVDVGGQRSQRHKWFQCFENVTSILFLASSSEFDQVLAEDRVTNRLRESASIFDTIVNHRYFRNTSVILFLNKTDLLEEKLSKRISDIRDHFPEFPGDPGSLQDVQQFQLGIFIRLLRDPCKSMFHHFTTAVDTKNIKVVFSAVKDTILRVNLQKLMLQ